MKLRRYFLLLDLKNDKSLIEAYEKYHQNVWPEILSSIKEAGITTMEIYRWSNRLVMMMEVDESFSFEKKALSDKENPMVQKWEQLMWKFQQSLPGTLAGEKWQLMDRIFELDSKRI